MAGLNQLISASSPSKIFWGQNLVGFEQIWLDLGENWEN